MCGGGNSNILTGLGNAAVNLATLGIVGFDDGELTKGLTTSAVEDVGGAVGQGIKEVTGAQAAEDANTLAREQLEEEKATALQLREEAKAQTAADQLAKSRQASGARGTATSRTTGSRAATNIAAEERDFLGL